MEEEEEEEEEDKTERRSRKAVAPYTGTDLKIRHLPPATHPIGSCDGWKLRKPLGEDAGIVTTMAFWGAFRWGS